MPTRIRARYKDQIVTVLDKTLKKRGTVNIRNGHGFPEQVNAKDLTLIPEDEPGSRLKFGDDA